MNQDLLFHPLVPLDPDWLRRWSVRLIIKTDNYDYKVYYINVYNAVFTGNPAWPEKPAPPWKPYNKQYMNIAIYIYIIWGYEFVFQCRQDNFWYPNAIYNTNNRLPEERLSYPRPWSSSFIILYRKMTNSSNQNMNHYRQQKIHISMKTYIIRITINNLSRLSRGAGWT